MPKRARAWSHLVQMKTYDRPSGTATIYNINLTFSRGFLAEPFEYVFGKNRYEIENRQARNIWYYKYRYYTRQTPTAVGFVPPQTEIILGLPMSYILLWYLR